MSNFLSFNFKVYKHFNNSINFMDFFLQQIILCVFLPVIEHIHFLLLNFYLVNNNTNTMTKLFMQILIHLIFTM